MNAFADDTVPDARGERMDAFPITGVAPWRRNQPLTGGLVAQWLRMEFTGLAFRDGFNRKSSIFTFPEQRGDSRLSG